jgi:hypothetical protein
VVLLLLVFLVGPERWLILAAMAAPFNKLPNLAAPKGMVVPAADQPPPIPLRVLPEEVLAAGPYMVATVGEDPMVPVYKRPVHLARPEDLMFLAKQRQVDQLLLVSGQAPPELYQAAVAAPPPASVIVAAMAARVPNIQ